MSVKIISGNIIDSDAQYIAHQCNCLTTYGAGTAKAIFDKFPYSDIYKTREFCSNWRKSRDKAPSIVIRGNGEGERYVINMLAQIFPGKPKFTDGIDCSEKRLKYFRECLISILKISGLKSIAFPYGIGCNLAGGDWEKYSDMLDGFSRYVNGDVFILRIKSFRN